MKKNIRSLLVFAFLVFCNLQTKGQPAYIFRHLTTDNGLSNNHVTSILKDKFGFLWIGTESGLNRYDGYGFKVYTVHPHDFNSLLTNDIGGLSEDGLGNIWIYVGFGYMVYDHGKDGFITDIPKFLKKLSITVGREYKIYVDKSHDLWVFSNQKIFHFDTRRQLLKVYRQNLSIIDLSTMAISDDSDNLFIINKAGLLFQFEKNTGKLVRVELPDFIRIEIANNTNKIYVDSYNGLWLSPFKSDLIYYRRNPNQKWQKLTLHSSIKTRTDIVQSISDDKNGQVWVGTDHKGVFLFNIYKGTISNIHYDPKLYTSIASNNVDCIYRDNEGTIWLGHDKVGISYFHKSFQNIVNIQYPECRDISAIYEDRSGNIWFGTDGKGIFVKKEASVKAIQKLAFPNFAVVCLLEDRKGRMWIGTYQNGLFCYENGKILQLNTHNSDLSDNNIWNLQEDCYGDLWVGSLGGKVQCLHPDSKIFDPVNNPKEEVKYAQSMYYDGR
ncbi:MAG: two-component regulator propeller domain-containing protein, partial [Bacteroidota bacterium]|nr:two-component regulator propeller domain-containing protein [Bacteroidota bacterium]